MRKHENLEIRETSAREHAKASSVSLAAWLVLSFAISFPVLSFAAFSSGDRGTTTASFLKLGAGARASAMGEAFSATADDASALYWNPAALTLIPGRSATLMHASYLDSSGLDYGAYGQNLRDKGAFGVGLQYFSAGSVKGTDSAGVETGSFNPNDLAFTAGYGYRVMGDGLWKGLSVGVSAKYIQSKILETARTGALDFGVLSPALVSEKLRLGFTLTNLGGKMKYEDAKEDLPLAMRLGSSYKLTEKWLAALDVAFPKDNDPHMALGTEYVYPVKEGMSLAGRAGYNSRSSGVDGFSGFSFGLGFGFRKFALDYALIPFGDLGNTHRFSLTLAWGGKAAKAVEPPPVPVEADAQPVAPAEAATSPQAPPIEAGTGPAQVQPGTPPIEQAQPTPAEAATPAPPEPQ